MQLPKDFTDEHFRTGVRWRVERRTDGIRLERPAVIGPDVLPYPIEGTKVVAGAKNSQGWADEFEHLAASANFRAGLTNDDLESLGSLRDFMRQAHHWASEYEHFCQNELDNGRVLPEWKSLVEREADRANKFCDLIEHILQSNGGDV